MRRRAARALAGCSKVLDFWGGGESADVFTAAGLSVVSYENGANLPDGLTRARAKRAVQMLAPTVPYDLRWGSAFDGAAECDCAFLDFCGHYTSAMGNMLRACRHMETVVVTVMPERTTIGQHMTAREWNVALVALLTDASGMYVFGFSRYARRSGLPAAVVKLSRHRGYKKFAALETALVNRRQSGWAAAHPERRREIQQASRERRRDASNAERRYRYANDAAYREERLTESKERQRRKREATRERKRRHLCHRCGGPLPDGSRRDARYCGVRCRVAAHRESHRERAA
jgi:hypothetical protein